MTDKKKKPTEVSDDAVKETKGQFFDLLEGEMAVRSPKGVPPLITINKEEIKLEPFNNPSLIPGYGRYGNRYALGVPCNGLQPMHPPHEDLNKTKWFKGEYKGITFYATEGSSAEIQIPQPFYFGSEGHNGSVVLHESKLVLKTTSIGGVLTLANSMVDINSSYFDGNVSFVNSTVLNVARHATFNDCSLDNVRINNSQMIWVEKSELYGLTIGKVDMFKIGNTTITTRDAMWWTGSDRASLVIQDQGYMQWSEFPSFYHDRETEFSYEITHRTHYGAFTGLVPVPFARLVSGGMVIGDGIVVHLKDLENMIPARGPFSGRDRFSGDIVENKLRDKLAIRFAGVSSAISAQTVYDNYSESFEAFLRAIVSRLRVFQMVAAVAKAN